MERATRRNGVSILPSVSSGHQILAGKAHGQAETGLRPMVSLCLIYQVIAAPGWSPKTLDQGSANFYKSHITDILDFASHIWPLLQLIISVILATK